MNTVDDHTATLLRDLRRRGKLSDPAGIDDETARSLLRTPPSSMLQGISAVIDTSDAFSGLASASKLSGRDEAAPVIIQQLHEECSTFLTTLDDHTRLARDQMQRSILQLFEDTIREKLGDALHRGGFKVGGGSRHSLLPPVRSVSKRPVDRGLDKRDMPSDLVVPDSLREQIANDIAVAVDHELKRLSNAVTTDVQKVLGKVASLKNRMERIEEDVLQLNIDNRMQAEQLMSHSNKISSLLSDVQHLETHNREKDAQMDIIREQITRRNQALEELRVRFRREVMRYKTRIYELEIDLDIALGRKKGTEARRPAPTEEPDDPVDGEPNPIVDVAVKAAVEQLQEEMRQLRVAHAKEKKQLMGEHYVKLSERDHEIQRLKAKLAGRAVDGGSSLQLSTNVALLDESAASHKR